MRSYQVDPIASLGRGLQVITTLHRLGAATLHELFLATGIPKATLTRILVTANQHGMVWQRLGDGAFLPSHRLDPTPAGNDPSWLGEVAGPALERLTDATGWPTVLCVLHSTWLEMLDTTSRRALVDDVQFRAHTNYRANLLRSASGQAFLAHCAPELREDLIGRLAADEAPGNDLARDRPTLDAALRACRARGYAVRLPDHGGHYDLPRSKFDDGRQSIAVPIRAGYAIATVNVTWRRSAMSTARGVARYLAPLRDTATEIEELVERR
ncbi:MAG: IclR family transcriptional regulator C-terminal domain-containing protein [Dermatophilaceae bacterium]